MKSKKLFILLTILLLGSIPLLAETNEEAIKFYNMGNDYIEDGLFDKAIECYQKSIEINPDDILVYANMGYAYNKKRIMTKR